MPVQLSADHRALELQHSAPLPGHDLFECRQWTPDGSNASKLRACIPNSWFRDFSSQQLRMSISEVAKQGSPLLPRWP